MGGDPKAPNVGRSTGQALQALIQNMPELTRVTGEAIPALEQSRLGAAKATSPEYAALQEMLFRTYGPSLARAGNAINREEQLGQAQTDVDTLGGPGMQAVQKAIEADRLANPEYYSARSGIAGGLGTLLSPGLSGGERAEVERSINRERNESGTLSTPTATSTVEAASTFGNALRDRLGAGIQAAGAVLPGLQSGLDTFKIATGRDSRPNVGTANFAGVTPTSDTGSNLAGGFMNNIFGLQNQANDINANRRDSLDRVTGVLGSLPNIS